MTDAALQLLLLLGYLAIGLISITFPIYAICVTYLRQEKWESEKERKQRIGKLTENIERLTRKLPKEDENGKTFKEIKEQIEKYEAERSDLELRVSYLSAWGAVGKPVILLLVALSAAGAGIVKFYEQSYDYMYSLGIISALASVAAIAVLYRTLSAVEQAALRPARTVEFEVCYKTRNKSAKVKVGEEVELNIGVSPREEDVENLRLNVFFSPEIEVTVIPADACLSLQPEWYPLANYTMVTLENAFVPRNSFTACVTKVLPKKIGIYEIPVVVNAKGAHVYRTALTLEVTQ